MIHAGETPAQVLATREVLDAEELAFVLGKFFTKGAKRGQPDPLKARELMRTGRLRVVDPDVPERYWSVSRVTVERYITGGDTPRRLRVS